jgi:predicted kinase
MAQALATAATSAGDACTAAPTTTATTPQRQQTLLLIKGLPGTGKSALALALARRLKWPLIDKDDARDALEAAVAAPIAAAAGGGNSSGDASSSGRPTPQQQQQEQQQPNHHHHPHLDLNAASYEVMFRFAAAQLRAGLSAIVDCPFSRRALYDRACSIAAEVRAFFFDRD